VNWSSYYIFWLLAPTVVALVSAHPGFLAVIVVALVARNRLPDPYLFFRHLARLQRLKAQVDLNPGNAAAHRELAMLYLARRRPALARPHIEAALQRNDSAELHYLRGLAALGEQRFAEALDAFAAAVERDPKLGYGDPYLRAGDAFCGEGRLDDALDAYERAIEINSSSVEGRYKLARLQRRLGDRDAAQRWLTDSVTTYRQLPAFLRRQHFAWYARARLRSFAG
jgi:tetratricopeptide (TPR) repeat protein